MKNYTKKFSAVFGNSYELEILSKERVFEILDKEIEEEDVLKTLLDKKVNGNRVEAFLNVSTGEVEYHTFTGNTDLQQKGHLIELYSIQGIEGETLDVEDFLSEEEMVEAGDSAWEFIRELDDYQERLYDAYIFNWMGFDKERITEQVESIYQ